MEKEIWKDIPGYGGYYQASTLGRIRGVDRYVNQWRGGKILVKGIIMKQAYNHNGYLAVTLKRQGNIKRFSVHVLILITFTNKPTALHECNHKDSIRDNNELKNLEWMTKSENAKYSFSHNGRIANKPWKDKKGEDMPLSIPVIRYDKNDNYIDEFDGMSDAERKTGIRHTNISKVCNGERKYAGGFIWKLKIKQHG